MCEDKNQSFHEADTIVFGDHNQACPKYSKQQVFAIFLQLLLNLWLIVEMWPAWVFSIGITLVDDWLNWFHFLFLEVGLLVIQIDCRNFLSPFLDVTRMPMSTVSVLSQLLWNSLPIECFPLTCDLKGFKFRINKHLSSVGSC